MDYRVILGIETSCDDTAASVVAGGELLSNVLSSQLEHQAYGGVVPEIASRSHQRYIMPVVDGALSQAGAQLEDLDAVAATYGPGLSDSLLVGLSFAKALAFGLDIPLAGVNHLEGHIYSVMIEPPRPALPYICLIASGGHSQLVRVEEGFHHTVLGRTRDDAAGEAFDKVAKLLGLGYPGGPQIDRLARKGDRTFHDFPRSRPGDYDFSFSGLKTSVLYYLNAFSDKERNEFLDEHLSDVCASVQEAIVDVLVARMREAVRETGLRRIAVTGGVSANTRLREAMLNMVYDEGGELYMPALEYTMDNAAMIATTASYKLAAGQISPLSLAAEPALAL